MKLFKYLCGLIIIPILYIRYSLILFLIFYLTNKCELEKITILWFIYAVFFGFIMGNCGVMKYWTKLFVYLFNIKYDIIGYWSSEIIHSHSMWSHPILKIGEKEWKLSIATRGGNLYNEDDNLRRKAIFYWLFG